MGSSNSKNAHNRREAEAYAKRKKAGFKDPGLEQHRQACVNQKKHLRHVQDPDNRRHKKQQQQQKGVGTAPAAAGYTGGGFNQAEIVAAKAKLKHRG